jgi:hypothetical protein
LTKVRTNVFGSRPEREAFERLKSRWSPRFEIYPNLPLANIFEVPTNLTALEQNFFLKTSVDYTLCRPDGAPVLSVEFDGMGAGFSRGQKYVGARPTRDPNRAKKLDFKLRLADEAFYRLLVVSFDETNTVDAEDELSILDGIIAQVVVRERIGELVADLNEEIEQSGRTLSDDEAQDLLLEFEVEAEMENDPFERRIGEFEIELHRLGVLYSTTTHAAKAEPKLAEPPEIFPSKSSSGNLRAKFDERIQSFRNANRLASAIEVKIKNSNVVIPRCVWIRNLDWSTAMSLSARIGRYLAFKTAVQMYK